MLTKPLNDFGALGLWQVQIHQQNIRHRHVLADAIHQRQSLLAVFCDQQFVIEPGSLRARRIRNTSGLESSAMMMQSLLIWDLRQQHGG